MPEPSRQLAAIMFTDIVGYTKLMGEDEEASRDFFDTVAGISSRSGQDPAP
jgi:class 3 adenylate cyclase